jgi:hypothetical protein
LLSVKCQLDEPVVIWTCTIELGFADGIGIIAFGSLKIAFTPADISQLSRMLWLQIMLSHFGKASAGHVDIGEITGVCFQSYRMHHEKLFAWP